MQRSRKSAAANAGFVLKLRKVVLNFFETAHAVMRPVREIYDAFRAFPAITLHSVIASMMGIRLFPISCIAPHWNHDEFSRSSSDSNRRMIQSACI